LRLRKAVGPVVGANLDPSHLFCTGADPHVAAEALGQAVFHVHAKDTMLKCPGAGDHEPTGSCAVVELRKPRLRSGRTMVAAVLLPLKMAGYDGWLSIEHEDVMLNSIEGLRKSVALLKSVMPTELSDYTPQSI
jgi:sugar phosphate isomerase/epimerase